jgi:antitoxin component YwqK of YwqJK toxin-antitoxin module
MFSQIDVISYKGLEYTIGDHFTIKKNKSDVLIYTYLGDSVFNVLNESKIQKKDNNEIIYNTYGKAKMKSNGKLYSFGIRVSVNKISQNIVSIYNYSEGEINGECIKFDDSSNVRYKSYYKNNLENGICTSFYSNGNIKSIGEKVNGYESGLWKYYFENGKLKEEGDYQIIDISEYKYENKNLEKNKYFFSFKDGLWKVYNEDGSFCETIEYELDEIKMRK